MVVSARVAEEPGACKCATRVQMKGARVPAGGAPQAARPGSAAL